MAPPTTVINLSADQWASRVVRLFPRKWSGDQARKLGGILFAICYAIGDTHTAIQDQLLYAFNASRIATAEDEALDRVCADFFDPDDLFRLPGEPDSSFRIRIYANLFPAGATRAAIIKALTLLTGFPPRLIEPWSVIDCASLDTHSYADIDTVDNPGRIADTGLRGAIFIESRLPNYGQKGLYPVYGLDAGLAADISFCIDPQPTWFLGAGQLDKLINRVRARGIKAWRKYQAILLTTTALGGTKFLAPAATNTTVTIFPAFAGNYSILACPSWDTDVGYQVLSNSSFQLTFTVPAPAGGSVDWMAVPVTVPGFGVLPIVPGKTDFSVLIPTGLAGSILFAKPSWTTPINYTEMDTIASFDLAVAAPADTNVSYGCFDIANSGIVPMVADQPSATIVLPGAPLPYQAFAMPSWDTTVYVQKTATSFTMFYSVLPPSGATMLWGVSRF